MVQGIPDLRLGSRTAEVGNWQRFLASQDIRDFENKPINDDEDFGPRTQFATRNWQANAHLEATGIVTPKIRLHAARYGFIPFIQAKNYTRNAARSRIIKRLIIHTMENDEKPTTSAENVAMWFAGMTPYAPPQASAGYCCDRDSTVQCVRDVDVAWHAPGANHDGIGIELAGRASQTREQWQDSPSAEVLLQAAKLCASLTKKYSIPVLYINPEGLRLGESGISGHHDVTLAFPGQGRTHWDPGPHFPWDTFLEMVRAIRERS